MFPIIRNVHTHCLPKLQISRQIMNLAPEFIYGIHPVLSALTFRQRELRRLYVRSQGFEEKGQFGLMDYWINYVEDVALSTGVLVEYRTNKKLSELTRSRAHQGVVLEASPILIRPISNILTRNYLNFSTVTHGGLVKKINRPLVLFLDHLTDVMNLGSILRSALFFGVYAVILSAAPSVNPSPLVSKLSAGAMECLQFFRLTDPVFDLKSLSSAGFLIVGTMGNCVSEIEEVRCKSITSLNSLEVGVTENHRNKISPQPLILALGSESNGLTQHVINSCNILVRIPGSQDTFKPVQNSNISPLPSSLNVAVATGILLYHLTSLRHGSECLKSAFSVTMPESATDFSR